jgi:citrate synthase
MFGVVRNVDQRGLNDQPPTADAFLTVDQAAALLGVKRQTLYAYVSRGLLHPAPSNGGRASLYARADLLRLKARSDARSGHGPVAAAALRWGEPVLETAVSTIDGRGPVYRGVPAIELAQRGVRFETAAELLWGDAGALDASRSALEGKRSAPEVSWPAPSPGLPVARLAALLPEGASPIASLLVGVPAIGERDPHRHLLSGAGELAVARSLILRMAAMLALPDGRDRFAAALAETSVARAVLAAFGVRPTAAAVRAVDAALVLCADHELNPSTFAVRVAASTGADLYACVSVGLSVLSGPQHGGVSYRVEALLAEAAAAPRPADVIAARARRGEPIPGFGHTLYRSGDPRAPPLLAAAAEVAPSSEALATMRGLLKAMAAAGHEPPTVDMGLVAVATALGLPSGGAAALFAIGRSAGWIAHAIEQRAAGFIVRPRARYTGP